MGEKPGPRPALTAEPSPALTPSRPGSFQMTVRACQSSTRKSFTSIRRSNCKVYCSVHSGWSDSQQHVFHLGRASSTFSSSGNPQKLLQGERTLTFVGLTFYLFIHFYLPEASNILATSSNSAALSTCHRWNKPVLCFRNVRIIKSSCTIL